MNKTVFYKEGVGVLAYKHANTPISLALCLSHAHTYRHTHAHRHAHRSTKEKSIPEKQQCDFWRHAKGHNCRRHEWLTTMKVATSTSVWKGISSDTFTELCENPQRNILRNHTLSGLLLCQISQMLTVACIWELLGTEGFWVNIFLISWIISAVGV